MNSVETYILRLMGFPPHEELIEIAHQSLHKTGPIYTGLINESARIYRGEVSNDTDR